jgi:beta-glucanase (GH16 family)
LLSYHTEYGQCGVGAYCLGGCDPLNSNTLDSCVPAPVCKSQTFQFNNLNGIVPNTEYLGDASKADWVSSGTPLPYQGTVLLTMAEGTVGTLLASTHYVWYGKTTAKFTTSAGAGVVTAFILLSDVKDEIDFEFVGTELSTAQTNFYSQGITNCESNRSTLCAQILNQCNADNNGMDATLQDDVHVNEHTYEIDWQPDTITWSINGNVVRTLNRADTWNDTANMYNYPQTPARVQLSLWPGGLPTNGKGTIQWAGGLVDWNSPYMATAGNTKYYYAAFSEVDIQCYSPPSGANIQGSKSYIYTDPAGTNNTVEITNDNTVLKSLLGTGTNMSANYPSVASSASGSAQTSNLATIPGLSGAGPGTNGQRGDTTASSAAGGSATGSGPAATGGFVQGSPSGLSGAPPRQETVLQGSFFAVLVAIIALIVL